MATVLLVHGAWHGAWCWERVTAGLADRGISSVAVDLPGHGNDTGPLTDLTGDAARVSEAIDALEPPIVLVGHSYGGAVITEAGDHDSVRHLVYLCAFALDEGESCASAAVDETAAAGISHEGRPDLGAALVFDEKGDTTLDRELAARCFYDDCDPVVTAWALDQLGSQSMSGLQQSPSRIAWQGRPSTYVVCTEDLAVHPDLQRIMATRCTDCVEWDSGHSPFLSQAPRLVGLLADLVAQA